MDFKLSFCKKSKGFVGSSISDSKMLSAGVPQGLYLGPYYS